MEKLRNTENKIFAAEIPYLSDYESIMEQCLYLNPTKWFL